MWGFFPQCERQLRRKNPNFYKCSLEFYREVLFHYTVASQGDKQWEILSCAQCGLSEEFFPQPFPVERWMREPIGLWRRSRDILVQLCSTCSCWESELQGVSSTPPQGWETGVSLLGLVLTLHLSRLHSELRISSYVITVVHLNHLGLNIMGFAQWGSFFCSCSRWRLWHRRLGCLWVCSALSVSFPCDRCQSNCLVIYFALK